MTNEEKAQEICEKNKRFKVECSSLECYLSAMEMAEWKERQMIEKAFDFIAEWFYEHPHSQMVCSDEFETVDKLLNRLKKQWRNSYDTGRKTTIVKRPLCEVADRLRDEGVGGERNAEPLI